MQGESTDVLVTMDSVNGEEFPTKFINKLVPIMEHSKDEVMELLKSKPVAILKKLRDLAFAELVGKLPKFAGREMYARKKEDLLAEDIYVFCYSARNALPDKRLNKICLKPELDLDSTNITVIDDDSQNVHDIQSLIELCVQLQEKVSLLENKIQSQHDRILVLEASDTTTKIGLLIDRPTIRSKDQAEGGVTGQPGFQEAPSQPDEDRKHSPIQRLPNAKSTDSSAGIRAPRQLVNADPGPQDALSNPVPAQTKKKDGPVPALKDSPAQNDGPEAASQQIQCPDSGFQYSNQERRKILKGNFRQNAANGQTDIRGTSSARHRIKAAIDPSSNKYLVYVGKLALSTTCDDVRCHLSDFEINNVFDVINLNGNSRYKENSFCISLGSELAMLKVFDPEMWPSGVVVRPFRPAKSNRRNIPYGRQRGMRHNHRHPRGTNPRWTRSHQSNHVDDREENRHRLRVWNDQHHHMEDTHYGGYDYGYDYEY